MKVSPVAIAVISSLLSVVVFAEEQAPTSSKTTSNLYGEDLSLNIERIQIMGMNFNNYKVGSSSGAMRGDIDLMDTPQSVNVIPSFVTDEQLATNLSEVLVND